MDDIRIRRLNEQDSLEELTELLHQAYKPHAERGLHFVATHQTVEMTRSRLANAVCFVAELDGCVVGTISYYPPKSKGGTGFNREDELSGFGQYGVLPGLKKKGIGSLLLQTVEEYAWRDGVTELYLDTAVPATDLIQLYEKKGYEIVGSIKWEEVNYPSVIMRKILSAPAAEITR